MEQWRAAGGQATSEYVALVALVAAVLALAAGLTSGGLSGQVLAGMQRGLCRVAGTACPPSRPAAADLAPCPIESTTTRESLDGAVEVLTLGRSGTLTTARLSDGRVTVSLARGTTVGAQVGLGAEVALGSGHGGRAQAGVSASVASGRSWTLPNAAAARAFVARYGSKATLGGEAVDTVRSGCSILCDAVGWRPHAELPPPDERWMSQGAAAKLEAPVGIASLKASGDVLLGARVRRDGATTWFMQLDAAIAGELGFDHALLGAGADAGIESVVSYTLDAERRPVELALQTITHGELHGSLRVGRGGAGAGDGLVTELDATLDLHDADNRAAALAFLDALRDPLAPGGLRRGAAAVHERLARAGIIDRRRYALSSSAFDLGATAAFGVQLGGTFARTHEGMRLLSAETRLPGLPFLPRDDCRLT
jgi:hypothetical protein